jgi:CopZ-like zinc binding protein
MSDCCSTKGSSATVPAVLPCPINGARSKRVELLTVKSLVRKLPFAMPRTAYYFCETPDCDVVYFPLDKQAPIFYRRDLLVKVGAKETMDPVPVCYCFGVSRKDIEEEIKETDHSAAADRITGEVQAGNCACEVKNPSGKCCLGAVNQVIQSYRRSLR